MRKVKRWRYYCDFCKKVGGQGAAMIKHEKYCTLNPNRECRMCDIVDAAGDIKELIVFTKTLQIISEYNHSDNVEYKILDNAELKKLRAKADNCPSCILATLRQAKLNAAGFDFQKEVNEMWKEHNSLSEFC